MSMNILNIQCHGTPHSMNIPIHFPLSVTCRVHTYNKETVSFWHLLGNDYNKCWVCFFNSLSSNKSAICGKIFLWKERNSLTVLGHLNTTCHRTMAYDAKHSNDDDDDNNNNIIQYSTIQTSTFKFLYSIPRRLNFSSAWKRSKHFCTLIIYTVFLNNLLCISYNMLGKLIFFSILTAAWFLAGGLGFSVTTSLLVQTPTTSLLSNGYWGFSTCGQKGHIQSPPSNVSVTNGKQYTLCPSYVFMKPRDMS